MRLSSLRLVTGCLATTVLFYAGFALALRAYPEFPASAAADGSVAAKLLLPALRGGGSLFFALACAAAIHLAYRALRLTPWFGNRRIADRAATPRQAARELLLGANLLLAAGLQGTAYTLLSELGYTRIYASIDERGWAYAAVSVAIYVLVADTWFYFMHRWFHDSKFIFQNVHRVHHLSVITTPLTSNQVSPIELLVSGSMGIVTVLIVPIAAPVLFVLVVFFTVYQMLFHSGFELFPSGTATHRIGKWLVTPTYHQMHHELYRRHMGLYFTWWDRWLGTYSPDYERRFAAVTRDKGHR